MFLKSWNLGTISGIKISIHSTFLILIGFITLSHLTSGVGMAGLMGELIFTAILFGIVVLHELGHALMARKFGIGTRDITLYPIGGVARLEYMPKNPVQEILISFAGPAVNVGLALAGWLISLAFSGGMTGYILSTFVTVNVTLAVFNLLPAFPMDGGRVLRSFLAMNKDYLSATAMAVRVGRTVALILGVIGLFTNTMLVFIAIFIWMAGSAEERSIRAEHRFGQSPFFGRGGLFRQEDKDQYIKPGVRVPQYDIEG